MKSTGINIGSVNLKGKKVKRLRCGCCTAYDFREREMKRAGLKEIRNFDIGATVSEETQKNIKAIEDNTRYAMMNAHKIFSD